MESCVLPLTAKLDLLTKIQTRFVLDHTGKLHMRFDLKSNNAADTGLIPIDGSWASRVVSSEQALRWKKWVGVEGALRDVRVASASWRTVTGAEPGCLVLGQDGLHLVVHYWHKGEGSLMVSLATGEFSWLGDDEAMVIDDWSVEGWNGEIKVFDFGGSPAIATDLKVRRP